MKNFKGLIAGSITLGAAARRGYVAPARLGETRALTHAAEDAVARAKLYADTPPDMSESRQVRRRRLRAMAKGGDK